MQLNLSEQMIRVICDALAYCVANKIITKHDDGFCYKVDSVDALDFFGELLAVERQHSAKSRQNRSLRDCEVIQSRPRAKRKSKELDAVQIEFINHKLDELAAEDQAARAETWAQTQDRERNQ